MIFTPIFMFSFLLRKEIILFVLGQDFIPAIPLFSWMLLATYILLLANPYDYALYATKKHASLVKVNLISLILSWLLSVYLMSYLHLGAVGAAAVVTAYGLSRKILAFLFILTLFTLSCQPES